MVEEKGRGEGVGHRCEAKSQKIGIYIQVLCELLSQSSLWVSVHF